MLEQKLTQTPGETEPALSDLADRLADMDKAEGVFGEIMTEEELEDVAGGVIIPTKVYRCDICGVLVDGKKHDHCQGQKPNAVCPFVYDYLKPSKPDPAVGPRP